MTTQLLPVGIKVRYFGDVSNHPGPANHGTSHGG